MNTDDLFYDCRESSKIDNKFISDFLGVKSAVFGTPSDYVQFQKKYINNIYGDSILVVVYLSGNAIAARGMWRNDIDNRIAYQAVDTCVLSDYRKLGIFSEMTKTALNNIDNNSIIYNFPNQNSLPGYLKMGWCIKHKYRMGLFFSNKQYEKEHPVAMDSKYANWWLHSRSDFKYIKNQGKYYIVSHMKNPICYKIIAQVEKAVVDKLREIKIGFIFFRTEKKYFYNKNAKSFNVVSRKCEIDYIPVWKIDAI